MNPLDDPVWHALTGPHATVAEGGNLARRYRPEFTVWCALHPNPDAAAWDELAAVVGPDGFALLSGNPSDLHDWEVVRSFPIRQMVLDDPVTLEPVDRVVPLDASHAAAMATLVRATEPGPWADRTHELGNFFGVFEDDELIAMAGERLQLPTATEISAVCTDPAHRGRGFAAALVTRTAHAIQARGQTAFLHVRVENHAAIHVYERLGFATRAEVSVALLQRRHHRHQPPDSKI